MLAAEPEPRVRGGARELQRSKHFLLPASVSLVEGSPDTPTNTEGPNRTTPPPDSFFVGDHLDWTSDLTSVYLVVELPFILMMATASLDIPYGGTNLSVLVTENETEVFAQRITDDRSTCFYQGRDPEAFETRDDVREAGWTLLRRQQRTTVYFKARCHDDVLTFEGGPRGNEAGIYLASLCESHIPVLNELLRRYRLLTYDYFAYEVSAWDVPIWHVRGGRTGHVSVPLFTYASLQGRPLIYPDLLRASATEEERRRAYPLELITGADLEAYDTGVGVPGEGDLLDARNLMERGDYSGAVRRTATALEALLEQVLRIELLKTFDSGTVDVKLDASKTDFPGRLRQWEKLLGVTLPTQLESELNRTRLLRHEIAHQGRRLSFEDRGYAQRSVDTGRWIFNHIERNQARTDLREKGNTVRAIARPTLATRFPVEATTDGYVVKPLRPDASPTR